MFDLVFTLKNNLFNSFTELRYIMKNSLWRTVDEENFLEVDRNDRIFLGQHEIKQKIVR